MNDEFSQNPSPEQNQSQPPNQGGVPPQQPPPPGGYYAPRGPYPPYGPYGPPPRRNRWWLIPVAMGIGCLPWFILFIVFVAAIAGGGDGGVARGRHVALIRVSGVITAGRSGGGFFGDNVAGSEDLVAQLEKARKNPDARVIVLRINSPGGSPSGSEEVYNEIQRVRKSGKTIYTSMGDVAASGGYYIASASDKIYADANTLTGSIGVILPLADLSGLYKKIGYRPETVKAGKYKDMGSSDRPLTPEERTLLQGLVNDTYNNFTQAVAKGRNMTLNEVKKLAEGRIYSGNQALKVKLVDKIGGLHETVREAAKEGGISGEPKVVEYGRRGLFDAVFGSTEEKSHLKEAATRKLLEKLLNTESDGSKLR
ncbi:MAG: signal peptide peptidase SppA [Armatimonadetes bacterium]|nr:signal peptide peptidase SppA [Armatimonadota bacterium]